MKYPTPKDYEGGWTCVQVQWPNSPEWLGILLGLLTTPMQGRYWDERTGSIKDAQALARLAFEKKLSLEFL